MKEKESKQFILRFFAVSVVLLCLAAGAVILVDPFFHYHGLLPGLKAVETKEEFQVNGALEHLEYDALLLGASVVMNINSTPLDEFYGCRTQKAVASGAKCSTLAYYLDKAYQYRGLKYVFWGLDPDQLLYEPEADPTQDQILYLRDKNPFNDVNYLWNVDVLLEEIPNMLALSRHEDLDKGSAYDFAQYMSFGIDAVLADYQPTGEIQEMKTVEDEEYLRKLNANLDLIEAQVSAHPETEYKFFFTIASVLWWDIHYRDGKMERYFHAMKTAVERLDPYENVRFYSGVFNEEELLMDLDHYCDYCHADHETNERQIRSVMEEDRIITPETIEAETDRLREIVLAFEERLVEEGGDWSFLYEYAGSAGQTE